MYGGCEMNQNLFEAFDKYLLNKNLEFSGVVIGGAALILMGVISRATRDIDFLHPTIPDEIKKASEDFAAAETQWKLDKDWFNNGPISLQKDLPSGWNMKIQSIFQGKSLQLFSLGREDLIKSKLFAYCDRTQPDFDDLLKIKPSAFEIDEAFEWVVNRDQNPMWSSHVLNSFSELKKALGYE